MRLHPRMDPRTAPTDVVAEADRTGGVATVAVAAVDRRASVARSFEDHHVELLNFLRRVTRDDQVAEDLAQEAFFRLAREVEAGRPPEQARPWLFRVASNLMVSRARRARTVIGFLARHGPAAVRDEGAASPEERLLRQERRTELESLLDTLSTEARTALLLSAQGFTGVEIAASIGRSHAATRTLLTRTRITLRLALTQREQQP